MASSTFSGPVTSTGGFVSGGNITPSTDNSSDLGSASLEFKDGYFDGTLYADAIDLNGTAISATAAEINNAADVSARVQELTSTGAVTAGVQSVELNSINSITATAASADNHQGLFVIKATGHSDDHTFVFTSGTIDGTNSVALFEADNDALVLYIDSNGDGTIVENVGSVSLG